MQPFVQSNTVTGLVQSFQGAIFVFYINGLVCILVWSLIWKNFQVFGNGKSQYSPGKQTKLVLWYLRIKISFTFVLC